MSNRNRKISIIAITAAIFFCCLLFSSCYYTVYVQPHVSSISLPNPIDDEAGIYITPMDLAEIYKKSSFRFRFNFWGGNIRIPLGSPLREAAQDAFTPFFKRIFIVGTNAPSVAPYIVEVGLSDFNVTGGLDTRLSIICRVSKEGKTIFAGYYEGRGSGTQAAGLLSQSHAREQIRESAEKAFNDAFKKVQNAFRESLAQQ